jgi:putative membrane protein
MMTWFGALVVGHIVSVIAWMAGALYLPRLFVYHCGVAVDSETAQLFKIMERRLLFAITIPAAVAAWIFGLALVSQIGLAGQGWLHAKLVLVVGLSLYTAWLDKWRRALAIGENRHSARFFRAFNELPTVLMLFIVALVILKPF